jgi:NitT/TauT family transport system permease protein
MPMTERLVTDDRRLDDELAGLDALELGGRTRAAWGHRLWSATWPKIAAIVLFFGVWQLVVWSGWKPEYVLPGPRAVLKELWSGLQDGTILDATATTLRRALIGFSLAVVIGGLIGSVVARSKVLRAAVGSLITGLMTMPSIAWFPLAILLFKISEQAITFVVVLGAAPAIANGLISGADQVPPLLLRAGRVLGAKGIRLYRHVLLPASLPAFVSGLKQGWAFAWRSLLAGELLVIIAQRPSIGVQLQVSRDLVDAEGLIATMLVILVIGIVVDSVLFGTVERALRRRRGLLDNG